MPHSAWRSFAQQTFTFEIDCGHEREIDEIAVVTNRDREIGGAFHSNHKQRTFNALRMACLSKFSPDTHNTPTTFDEPSLSLSRIATRTRNEKKKKKNLKNSRRCGLCEYAGVMLMWIEMSKLANRRKRESCLRCGFYVFLILSVGFSRRTSIASVIYYKLESNMHPPMNHWTFSFSIFFIFVFCSRNTIDFAANTSWWFKQFSFIFR